MIILHQETCAPVTASIGLDNLHAGGGLVVEINPAPPHREVPLRIFVGPRTIGDWLPARTSYFAPTRRIAGKSCSCILLPPHRDIVSSPLVALAARHAVWSEIFKLCQDQRLRLRWSHLPLLARRDPAGVRPYEPYEIDLSDDEPYRAWHALRVGLQREPSTRTLHAVAVLQECDRVAAMIERTTGASQRVLVQGPLHDIDIELHAHRTAERLLERWPALGHVRGGLSRDTTAAERYLIREMTTRA